MSLKMFKGLFETGNDSTIDRVKTIIGATEEILDNAKIVLTSVIEMTDTFGSKYKEETTFGKKIGSGFSNNKKGPFSDAGSTFSKSNKGFSKKKSFINLDDISNLADILEYVSSEADAPITYGVKTVDENDATFVISPNLYIIENRHGDIVLHVNVDAGALTVKRASVGRIVDAFMALVNFVQACLEFTTADGIEASFMSNALVLNLDKNTSINAGLVILMIKALKDSDAEDGFVFNVGDYRCKVVDNNVLISKDGYSPASIPVDKFYFLHLNAPAFSDLQIDDKDFRQYSDNPNELFVRMIIELMSTHDVAITMDDIKIIDNVAGTSIKTNTLGLELKKMK